MMRDGLGIIDTDGNVVIDFVWDYVEDKYARSDEHVVPFYEHNGKNVYVVASGNTDFLIDTEGNILY